MTPRYGFRNSSGSLAIFAAIRRAFIFAEQLGCRRADRLILEIDIGELLPGAVGCDKAGVQFFDRPGRREAAGGHVWLLTARKHHLVMGITE
jgi:hypothetical protein